MVKVKYFNKNKFAIDINSDSRFYEVVTAIKQFTVRNFDKKSKKWIVPIYDFKSTAKLMKKKYGFNITFDGDLPKLKQTYNNKIEWANNQLRIKKHGENLPEFELIKESMDTLKHPLYPFQSVGAYFVYRGKHTLICDMVGLGKTIQSLAVCEKRFNEKQINFTMVICPSTLKKNWESEIFEFTDRSYIVVGGNKAKRKKAYKQSYKYDYLIVNYDVLRNDYEMIQEYIINRSYKMQVVIDEIQYIKNRSAKRSIFTKLISGNALYRIGLSATIIENNVLDLFSSLQAIEINVFGDNSHYFHFMKNFCKVNWFGKVIGYNHPDVIRKRMSPYYIRRFKEDVLDELPDKIENNYWVELSSVQRKFYDDMSKKIVNEIEDMEKAQKIASADILPMITYLRQSVQSSKLVGHKENISTKTDQLIDFLSSIDKKSKVVVFSYFVDMVEILKDVLDEFGYKNIAMHGRPKTRSFVSLDDRVDLIKEWDKDNSYKVLVASDILREGVNILSANYLINFDILFNPAKMEQRVGRIDRIGNKHKVINVINFIAKDTIEDSIFTEILSPKRKMSTDIMDSGETETRLTIKNIKNLLKAK